MFLREEAAEDLIEYAVLIPLLSLSAFGAMRGMGLQFKTLYSSVSGRLHELVEPCDADPPQSNLDAPSDDPRDHLTPTGPSCH